MKEMMKQSMNDLDFGDALNVELQKLQRQRAVRSSSLEDRRSSYSRRTTSTVASLDTAKSSSTAALSEQKTLKIPLTLSHWDSVDQTCKLDGPLSLHESTIMMNSDTGQSPEKSRSQSVEDPSQNSTEQMNGQINYDELCNIKNLKDEEVLVKLVEIVQALRGLKEYDRGETMKILKSIGDTYWSYRAIRKKIGDVLTDEGFAEITMKILKTLNGKGIFKNDSIWFPVYYCFNTMWNYSDASLKLAKSIAENDGVRFFTINCDHEPYLKNLHSKNVYYVVKASMSILHNISRTTDIHHHFKDNGTTEVMLKFATWKDLTYEMLKVMSLLTLAHIVEEEDNDKLIDETGAIECCVKYVQKALTSQKRRHLGFTPHELMDGMSKLAVNDKNKKKIVDAGALPIFLDMLKGDHVEEQAITARALWTLSFDKDVCQQIIEFPEMMERLEALRSSGDKEVTKNVNGALFVLKGENDVSKRPKSAKKNKGHVFISYSWNEKEIVMKLRERLKKEGVEVWIDVERMGGSTLSAMAEAVENAAVVLICMSEKYKQSPNCRLEAEYTFQMRKEYIPLMVQTRYRPDGWLGMILGAKLYFDFSGKYPFEKPWNGLMKELKGMGRLSVLDGNSTDRTDAPIMSSSTSVHSSQPIRQSSMSSKIYQMNTEDVSNWLCSLKLDGCVPSFAQFDGKLLAQLKSMKSEAAEFYYHCLEKNMNMNLVEILTFTDGLEKL
uniref:Uncharacterized protein LOC111111976 isoform X2 n=1 Tax=Crassostrea virginica TaxID=6565 RepID=A0A8B8BNI2_CRAVI|nr:uncharacterized protein LOC111111976 isoform X2 [Crassostrea virginica]